MKKIKYIFFYSSILLCFCRHQLHAQQNSLVSVHLSSAPFEQFVEQVEANSTYHFYFDAAETDSLLITGNFDNIPLQQLLDSVLLPVKFHYAIDNSGRVFINKRFAIVTSLPESNITEISPVLPTAVEVLPAANNRNKIYAENKIFEIGSRTNNASSKNTISGYIREGKNGEAISGAVIYIDSLQTNISSDQYGYYSLTLPPGKHTLKITYAGMKETRRQLQVYGSGKLDVEMQEDVVSLKAVTVVSEKTSGVSNLQMGSNKINIKNIKQVPVAFGETDVLKVVLTLPGVTSAGEAANGINVRGGSADQNLILFNGSIIYNPSHLFGFFSAFNPDVVKNIELYKSAIPEKFGGRISSVLDIAVQEGNKKKWSGNIGIGPLTSKISIEGPLKKNKSSLTIAGRTTYSNWLLKTVGNNAYEKSSANFYDINLNYHQAINAKNTLFISGYISNDKFNLNNDTTYRYGNKNIMLKWKTIIRDKLSHVASFGFDNYRYRISASQNPVNGFRLGFDISNVTFRSDFTYNKNNRHVINFGLNSVLYKLKPGFIEPVSGQSLVKNKILQGEQGLESAIYLGDNYTVNSKLSLNAGIRYSLFAFLGPKNVFNYKEGVPRDTASITDTSIYTSGKIIKIWHAPEIRVGLRYSINPGMSVKLSFNTLQQYVHMLSNSVSISPTDTWKLSDGNVKPQSGMQAAIGLYKNFRSNTIETSLEFYYKRIKNFLDYKSGASLLLNDHIETDLVTTKGRAYGAELMIKKTAGRLTGWLSYAYSRTQLQLDDKIAGEQINKGRYYPANFDRPHLVNLICNYKFSHRYSMSFNFVYNSGKPVTLPIGLFNIGGSYALLYSERNQYRIQDYIRADVSFTLDGNHKVNQKTHNFWSFGVYNLMARKNVYSVYFVQEAGKIKGYKLSIFGTAIPFITYNIRF